MVRTWSRAGLVAALVLAVVAAVLSVPSRAAAVARQLYVAPWGKDSWPGTFRQPFATPGRAQREARGRAGTVVNLRGGTYTLGAPLRLTRADSGVVYQAYGYGTSRAERVTLSGGRAVSGWRPDPRFKGVWRAEAGALETRQLYVEGRRAERFTGSAGGKLTLTKTGYVTGSSAPLGWRAPGDVEFVYRSGYVEGRCGVAGVARAGRGTAITMDEPCWSLVRELYASDELLAEPVAVENSPGFRARPGSWYLDRSRPGRHALLYVPRAGEDMRRARVVAPVLQALVSGAGVRDVAFRGLTFAYATWLAPSEPAGFPAAWSMYLRPDGKLRTVPGAVAFRDVERVALTGNRFTHLGAQAVELRDSSDSSVVGNVISDTSDGGIALGVLPPEEKGVNSGNRVTDNWIHHTGREYRASSAIWDSATRGTTLAHNQVDHVPYTGILSGPADDLRGIMRGNRIIGNRVFATNQVLVDGGGIYLRGEQGRSFADGAVISGNAVTGSRYGVWNVGIYTDDSTNWVTVADNAVYDYVASIGGCSEEWGGRPVRNVRYQGNFWDDAVPDWVARRPYPGAWPPADPANPEEGCGDPHELTFTANTLLPATDPGRACAADRRCAAVLAQSGPRPEWRRGLGLGSGAGVR
ncbi:right-handed parallel beta-helix repeat-containing protein [Streptomyces sp. 4F14]|uniref:right-handed parallel beta-helix repeat-containing protein n=1 Tax=Streptomyces sp. 4F14 TaxID=3394380 RepID=UPI003A83EEA8